MESHSRDGHLMSMYSLIDLIGLEMYDGTSEWSPMLMNPVCGRSKGKEYSI